jgi:hypothetical protein
VSKIKPPNAGKGRTKGTPNKVTGLLKDAIIEAASRAGGSNDAKGLVAYLEARAKDTPGPFLALVGKVLPMQIAGSGDGDGITFKVIYEAAKDAMHDKIA